MKKKMLGAIAAAMLVIVAFGATSASAATEFGDSCFGDVSTEGASITGFAFSAAGNPLPLTAPGAGVVTKWKVNSAISAPQTLKVLRQNGPQTVLIVGESAQNVASGQNTFETRIPVQAGDHLGLFGPSKEVGTIVCNAEGGGLNAIGVFEGGGGGPGSTVTFISGTAEARFPVSAVLEPDVDNDGYGDETQDKCPQNAAVQTACPVVALSTSARAKRGLAEVLVTTSAQAAVTVTGTVKTGKGKTVTLSGGTQVVLPGVISKFTLLFTQKLKAKLKQLPRKQSLTLNLTATAPNVVGVPSVSSTSVKLKGQKKPKPKKGKAKGQA